jgi:hypothetical protein
MPIVKIALETVIDSGIDCIKYEGEFEIKEAFIKALRTLSVLLSLQTKKVIRLIGKVL